MGFFPDIQERYQGKSRTNADLWQGYALAQVVGATFTKMFSERDTRPQLFD